MLQSGHQNPRWPPKWPLKYLTFNLDGLESSNTTLNGLSSAAEPFLKLVLQSGHQNPRWPPKWPPKYLTLNLDGLESHLMPLFMDIQGLQNHSCSWFCNPVTRIQDGRQYIYNCTDCQMLASIGVIFTILVHIMFPVA